MRDLTTVIREMVEFVPADETPLLTDFKDILTSIPYSPPEDKMFCWERTQNALEDTIGEYPTQEWHFQVLEVWTCQPIEQLKQYVVEHTKELK